MERLERAIQAIRSGNKEDGLRLLIEIVKTDPRNEQAWLWLGGTLTDPQKRQDCLKRVLQINPGNQKAARMLQDLEGGTPPAGRQKEPHRPQQRVSSTEERESVTESQPQPELAPQPQEDPVPEEDQRPFWAEKPPAESEPAVERDQKKVTKTERTTAESKIQRALALQMKGQTQKGLKTFVAGLDIDPTLANETFTRSVASELTGLHPDQAIKTLQDKEKRKELLNPAKDRAVRSSKSVAERPGKDSGPAPGLVQSWLSYFGMNETFFNRIIRGANTEDTLISVLVFTIATIISFFVSSFVALQDIVAVLREQVSGPMPDLGSLLLMMMIGLVIITPIFFFIGAGIQFLGLRLFGGSGTFKDHAYILAVITVPMTIVSLILTLPSLVPGLRCITGIAGLGLSIWSLIVTVRGMKVVHDLSTGRAIAGLILPPLILIFGGFCILTITGTLVGQIFENIINSQGGFPQ